MAEPLGLTHGVVYRKDTLYVAAVDPALEDADVYHGYVMRWRAGDWGHWKVANRIYALGAYDVAGERTVFAMGPDGRVQVADGRGFRWEDMDPDGDGPSQRRPVGCLRRVGDFLYAAGMSRMVYRRSPAGKWERASAGALVPRSSPEVAGFLGLDGFDPGDVYAVGFHGAIWQSDGTRWHPNDSPTNLKLECVRCTDAGQVFIAGAKGMILRGRNDAWDVVEQDVTEETFWGMEYAFGALYLSTAAGEIFRLAGDEFAPVELGLGHPITTRALHFNDGLLLSTGSHDLCVFDGTRWTEIAHP